MAQGIEHMNNQPHSEQTIGNLTLLELDSVLLRSTKHHAEILF